MVFLDHVQNLNIRAEKTHKDFGVHCMKYVNFVHDPEKQYRSTVPAVRPLSIGLQVTEVDLALVVPVLASSEYLARGIQL